MTNVTGDILSCGSGSGESEDSPRSRSNCPRSCLVGSTRDIASNQILGRRCIFPRAGLLRLGPFGVRAYLLAQECAKAKRDSNLCKRSHCFPRRPSIGRVQGPGIVSGIGVLDVVHSSASRGSQLQHASRLRGPILPSGPARCPCKP